MIGLESNLVFNYRFYGPYSAHFAEKQRTWQRMFYKDGGGDKTPEPLRGLIKELFPSSQGTIKRILGFIKEVIQDEEKESYPAYGRSFIDK